MIRPLKLIALFLFLIGSTAFADTQPGELTFQKNCVVCHRANGAGTPGLAPPIQVYPGQFAQSTEGRRQLIWTVLYGMYGDLVIDQRHYNFKMPIFGTLSNDELAAVLNHVVGTLNGKPDLATFSSDEIQKERGVTHDGSDVLKHRSSL